MATLPRALRPSPCPDLQPAGASEAGFEVWVAFQQGDIVHLEGAIRSNDDAATSADDDARTRHVDARPFRELQAPPSNRELAVEKRERHRFILCAQPPACMFVARDQGMWMLITV